MLTQNQLNQSKTISYYLRHKPEELNIKLDIEGWVGIDEFISKFNNVNNSNLELDGILDILNKSDKKRWEIDLETNSIRAIYGHSIDNLELSYPEITIPIRLYHGTVQDNLGSIRLQGLHSMQRQYVHLTPDRDLAIKTAQRKEGSVALIEIDTEAILKDKIPIYEASKSIYLLKQVDAKYII